MKLKFISMAVFSALTLGVATNASAATTVNGGTVHFKGEVVNAEYELSRSDGFAWPSAKRHIRE